ncbi:MAG: DNA gyrase C-terminal beta-propeller domain-containing protein, partial [Candidatus Poseidoniales archaeon]
VRSGTDEHNVVMVSNLGRACRFDLSSVRTQGRVSSGVRGIRLDDKDAALAGMILTNDIDTSVLTLSKQGMGKRTRLGKGEKVPTIRDGEQQYYDDGEAKSEMDGYRVTKRGGKGVITMNLNDGDVISRVHQIPDLADQLFLLSSKGVVIRISAIQTKETSGRSSKGTRVMELRSKNKDSFIDELIFSARMPAILAEEILTEKSSEDEELVENTTSEEE